MGFMINSMLFFFSTSFMNASVSHLFKANRGSKQAKLMYLMVSTFVSLYKLGGSFMEKEKLTSFIFPQTMFIEDYKVNYVYNLDWKYDNRPLLGQILLLLLHSFLYLLLEKWLPYDEGYKGAKTLKKIQASRLNMSISKVERLTSGKENQMVIALC